MKNTLLYCLLVVHAVLGQKLAFGDEVIHKSSVQVPSNIGVISTAQAPVVVTGEATFDYSTYILTVKGIVNAQGLPTTAWVEYDTVSGSYSNKSSIQDVDGTSDTSVEINVNITSLSPNGSGIIYYYYRVVTENEMGISYGEEKSLSLVTPIVDCLCGVSGKIMDAVSKEGIVNATIIGSEGSISYTNKLGYYMWDNGVVPCTSGGTYYLIASADGYESLTQYIDVQPCVGSTLDFELQPAGTSSPIPTIVFTPIPPTLFPTGTPSPAPTAIFTPILPTVFSTPIYGDINKDIKIRTSPRILKLRKKQSGVVTVMMEGGNGVLNGETVTAIIGKASSRHILILPADEVTNEYGQAQFTITARDKTGKARIIFKSGNVKKSIIVRVGR